MSLTFHTKGFESLGSFRIVSDLTNELTELVCIAVPNFHFSLNIDGVYFYFKICIFLNIFNVFNF